MNVFVVYSNHQVYNAFTDIKEADKFAKNKKFDLELEGYIDSRVYVKELTLLK